MFQVYWLSRGARLCLHRYTRKKCLTRTALLRCMPTKQRLPKHSYVCAMTFSQDVTEAVTTSQKKEKEECCLRRQERKLRKADHHPAHRSSTCAPPPCPSADHNSASCSSPQVVASTTRQQSMSMCFPIIVCVWYFCLRHVPFSRQRSPRQSSELKSTDAPCRDP